MRDVEYLIVTDSQWSDIKAVLQEHGLDCTYSEEEDGCTVRRPLIQICVS